MFGWVVMAVSFRIATENLGELFIVSASIVDSLFLLVFWIYERIGFIPTAIVVMGFTVGVPLLIAILPLLLERGSENARTEWEI